MILYFHKKITEVLNCDLIYKNGFFIKIYSPEIKFNDKLLL